MTTPAPKPSPDESALRTILANWRRAFESKNIDALTADYAPDIVLFDIRPPFRTLGIPAIKKLWQKSLPNLPSQFTSEHHDLHLEIDGHLAFIHTLHKLSSTTEPNHPACHSYLRVTACFRKINNQWKATHEHVSLPFDPTTHQAVPITHPIAT